MNNECVILLNMVNAFMTELENFVLSWPNYTLDEWNSIIMKNRRIVITAQKNKKTGEKYGIYCLAKMSTIAIEICGLANVLVKFKDIISQGGKVMSITMDRENVNVKDVMKKIRMKIGFLNNKFEDSITENNSELYNIINMVDRVESSYLILLLDNANVQPQDAESIRHFKDFENAIKILNDHVNAQFTSQEKDSLNKIVFDLEVLIRNNVHNHLKLPHGKISELFYLLYASISNIYRRKKMEQIRKHYTLVVVDIDEIVNLELTAETIDDFIVEHKYKDNSLEHLYYIIDNEEQKYTFDTGNSNDINILNKVINDIEAKHLSGHELNNMANLSIILPPISTK